MTSSKEPERPARTGRPGVSSAAMADRPPRSPQEAAAVKLFPGHELRKDRREDRSL